MTTVQRISLQNMPELLDSALTRHRLQGPHSDIFFDDRFTNYVQLLADDGSASPPYIFLGCETMLAKIFGRNYALTAAGRRGMPAANDGPALYERYPEVSDLQRPAADRITFRFFDTVFQYSRLTMPTQFGNGAPSFSVFVHLERSVRILAPPSSEDP